MKEGRKKWTKRKNEEYITEGKEKNKTKKTTTIKQNRTAKQINGKKKNRKKENRKDRMKQAMAVAKKERKIDRN